MTRYAASSTLGILIGLLLCSPAWSATSLQGHLKSFSILQQSGAGDQEPSQWASLNQLRLDSSTTLSPPVTLQCAAAYSALYRQRPTALNTGNANHYLDLTSTIGSTHHLMRQLEVDRLQLRWSGSSHELVIGRQAIGFGRIGLYSPLDIIAPFAPAALVTDVRPGIDALRWNYFYSATSQLQLIGVMGRAPEQRSVLATLETLQGELDVLILGGSLAQRPLLGVGAAGQLAGIGIKAELVGYRHQPTGSDGYDPHDRFVIAALEIDTRLPNGTYLAVEYLHNGSGTKRTRDYATILGSAFYQEQRAFLPGRDYLLGLASYEPHPLVTAALFTLLNLNDASALVRPELTVSLADNLSGQFTYTFYLGQRSRSQIPTSEYGERGDTAALHLTYYF